MLKLLSSKIQGDKSIWVLALLLSILSVLVVYSSIVTLAYKYQSGNTMYYLLKHTIIISVGFLIMYGAHRIPSIQYFRFSKVLFYLSVVLLVITLLTGADINEASRWLVIPVINQTFQTSDLAKLALYIYLVRSLVKYKERIHEKKIFVFQLLIPVVLVCGLILPANFSTAALLFINSMILFKVGGVRWQYLWAITGAAVILFLVAVILVWNFAENKGRIGTWKNRIESFINGGNKDTNYQVEQSKIAIARGGWIGCFPGNSVQRHFLPHPYSDFIYAIILEEYGFVGGGIVMVIYLVLLIRGMRVAMEAPTPFGSLLAFILTFSLLMQAFVNIGVAVNLFPVTGQPLPLVSMGGTSIWFTCLTLGIILSISRETEKHKSTLQSHYA